MILVRLLTIKVIKLQKIAHNIFGAILAEKEEENISGAAEKVAQIAEVTLKCIYQKIQKTLQRHPGIPELRSLFDYLGQCAAGWLWAHCFVVPRYVESSFKCTLVEVDDEHLSTGLSEKPNYGDGVIKDFLDLANQRMEDVIMDVIMDRKKSLTFFGRTATLMKGKRCIAYWKLLPISVRHDLN